MAEREGFEPSRRLPAYTRSRRAPSTTRPPLLMARGRGRNLSGATSLFKPTSQGGLRTPSGAAKYTREFEAPSFERDGPIAYVRVKTRFTLSPMLLLLRIIGVWFLLIAMVAAVIDATKSLAGGGAWVFTPLGQQWANLNPNSLAAAKTAVETHVGTFMWNPMITEILNAPTWVVFGILGVLLFWLGRKRAPAEVFIN